jgi:hypothetical protein
MLKRGRNSWVRLVLLVAAVLLLPLVAAVTAAPASAGLVVWQTGYSFDSRADSFMDIASGPGGAIYCAGSTKGTEESSTLLLAKYVDDGATVALQWTRTFKKTGVAGSRGTEVAVDRAGNVIVAGMVGVAPPASARGRDVVVIKYSPAGVRRWRTFYAGPAGRDDYVTGLGLDRSGNAYVSTTSMGVHTGFDFATVKVRTGGGQAWVRRYSGPSGRDETAGIAVLPSGDCFVSGSSANGSHARAVTIKYSAAGALRWSAAYSTDVGGVSVGAVSLMGSSAVIVGGSMWNGNAEGGDLVFLKYRASNGSRIWRRTVGNGEMFDESISAMDTDADGALYAAGSTHDENSGATHGFTAGMTAAGGALWTDEFWVDLASNDAGFQTADADAAGDSAAGGWAQTVLAGDDFAVRYRSRLGPASSWDFTTGGLAIGDDVCRTVLVDGSVVYAAGELDNGGATGIDAALFKLSR